MQTGKQSDTFSLHNTTKKENLLKFKMKKEKNRSGHKCLPATTQTTTSASSAALIAF